MTKHTHIRPKVCRSLHLDVQILVHFANDFYRVADGEMRVLNTAGVSEHILCWRAYLGREVTYAVQSHIDVSACVDDGGVAAQLHDYA